jgi:CHAT domain-containing protein
MAPSASFFSGAVERLRRNGDAPPISALLIGDPTSGSVSTEPGLPALAGAESEVVSAAGFYRRPMVLTGETATKRRFVDAAPSHDVVHFGGHAFVNAEYPLLSRLAFASATGEDPLFAYEISRIVFSNTRLVVLAACSTAVGAVSRGEGAMSVARPFLAAGVPTVVASQWDVDDRATEQLFVEFHRTLSRSGDPVQSLRSAQLALLRGANPAFRLPGSWAPFIVLGGTVR